MSARAPLVQLAAQIPVMPGARVLLLHADSPDVARALVERVGPQGQITALHTSFRALAALERVPGVRVSDAVYPDPAQHGPADMALLDLPKGREHARAYLWTVACALPPGAPLFLMGSNDGGAKSAVKDAAALFGGAYVLAHKGGFRLARATRPDALDFPAEWGLYHPWEPQRRVIARPDGDYTIITQPGVFSWDHLDDGTALLLDHLGVRRDLNVLDIGCGTGLIGLAAARAGARAVLLDDNLLAVRCAQASAAANDLAERCEVLPGDVTGPVRDRRFDLVLSNPPFHQGIDVTTGLAARFVQEAFDVLRRGGRLRLVANRFLPYDRVLEATFKNVRTVAETSRFRVLEAEKLGTQPPTGGKQQRRPPDFQDLLDL